jgi:hypothetical protein
LVLLDARALFSKIRVSELLDPAMQANRSAVERHHLYPKGYLSKLGITAIRDTNQIANYALVEWGDNARISDQAPIDYLPEMKARFDQSVLDRMYRHHALPDNWEHLEYREFLEKRRELMAQVIAEGYATLIASEIEQDAGACDFDLSQVVINGESEAVELKSTMRTNLHTGTKDPRMELAVLKTLAGFLNTNGGTLIVGVSDDGSPIGIETDGFSNEDKMGLHLVNIVKGRMGIQAMTSLHAHFDDHDDCRVMVVKCRRAPSPVFVKDGETERFYIRTGPSTTELSASQTQEYVKRKFKG